MYYLLATLKGAQNADVLWKVCAHESALLSCPSLDNSHDYDPRHKIEVDEWYRITNFAGKGFENLLISEGFNSSNYIQLSKSDYSKVLYLSHISDDCILFQKVTASQILKKKWLHISDDPVVHDDEPILILNKYPDAIYDKTHDILYFKDLGKIKPLFRGIESLYREATQAEVQSFLDHSFIGLEDGYSADKVKTLNRKRIAMVSDYLNRLDESQLGDLITYTTGYCADIDFSEGKFKISNEDQLKRVLFGLEERYYTTALSQEKRLANSIQRVE